MAFSIAEKKLNLAAGSRLPCLHIKTFKTGRKLLYGTSYELLPLHVVRFTSFAVALFQNPILSGFRKPTTQVRVSRNGT